MEINDYKKRSKQGARISAVGFILVLVSFIYGSYQLNEIHEQVQAKTLELQNKRAQLLKLDSTLTHQNKEIEAKQILVDNLISEINQLKDPTITPSSSATAIPGLKDSKNRQVYDFTVWVNSSNKTLNQIEKVAYEFGHGTFILTTRESSERSNGFLVSYRGWGCLSVVKIVITFNDGSQEHQYFEMCRDLETN